MKTRVIVIMSLVILSLLTLVSSQKSDANYTEMWKKVNASMQKDLPETAEKQLEEIVAAAKKEKNQPQLLKTILFRKQLFAYQDKPEQAFIDYAEAQLTELNEVAAAVLHIEIARTYNDYLDNHAWSIKDNLPIDSDMSKVEMKYWDRMTFRKAIDAHYAKALQNPDKLKSTLTKDYIVVFDEENQKDASANIEYEPTMFEFIFHRTASYYKGISSADDVDASWNTQQWWLADKDFVQVDLGESENPIIRCLKIFQELIAHNLNESCEDVLLYNDVKRYEFVSEVLNDEEPYHQILLALMQQYADNPLSAEICAVYAQSLVNAYSVSDSATLGNYAKALEMCNQSIAKFPKSKGGQQCKKIADYFLAPEVHLELQAAQLPNQPMAASLSYRNVQHPYYKIVKLSEDEMLRYSDLYENELLNKLSKDKAYIESTMDIPAETDYLSHSSLIALPELPVGQYYILFKTDKNTIDKEKMFAMPFQVSNLAYVYHDEEKQMVLYVVDRKTSKPIANVDVELYQRKYDYQERRYKNVKKAAYQTDKDGKVVLKDNGTSFYVNLRHGDDVLLSSKSHYLYQRKGEAKERYSTTFFTDRAIYRPGQTVYFKGVVLRIMGDDQALAEGMKETIVFRDANWQEISTQTFVTDEYGAFSGSFVIPTDRMNGVFQIIGEFGSQTIRVEEYKRPTFEVNFEKPKEQYKLNDNVTLRGSVDAYAGFGLDAVQYTYRVVRKTHFPWRFWWWFYPAVDDEQVAHGEARTDENGKFAINFMLKPSLKTKPEQQPVFTYEIEVTATSAQGETHSETYSIRAGYNEVCISTNLPSLVEKKALQNYNVEVLNMSGEPAQSKVSRKFYRYADNTKPSFFETNDGSQQFDRQLLSDAELNEKFPEFDYYEKSNRLKNKVLVYEDVVDVKEKASLFPEKCKFEQGRYLVELTSLDDPLAANSAEFTVFEEQSNKMPYTSQSWVRADKTTAQPDETVTFSFGSSQNDVNMWVRIMAGNEVRTEKWLKVNNGIDRISYKVKEADRGNLRCMVVFVKEGVAINRTIDVSVPYDNLNINVELATVRDVLRPGAKEHWEITVRDKDNNPLVSSLLAGMYDESLDVFAAHQWHFSMTPRTYFSNGFGSDDNFRTMFSNAGGAEVFYGSLFDFSLPSSWSFYHYGYSFYRGGGSMKQLFKANHTIDYEVCLDAAPERAMPSMAEGIEEEMAVSDDAMEMEPQAEAVPTLRENFNETAFFFPNLRTNADGSTTFSFTMPDALTRWKLMLLAYDKNRKMGYNSYSFKSSKPVMIMADMPRYMYDTDTLWLVANVINTGDEAVMPKAKLEIFDAATMRPIDLVVSDEMVSMEEIVPGRSKEVRWKVAARHDLGLVACRFTVYAGTFSDAEQHLLPVLSSEVFMTQTMPVTVKANTEKTFDFECVANPDSHERDYSLTLNFSANPVWYAVQALPYLAEQSTQRAESAFYVFYANALSAYIANQIPNLKNYIQKWQIETPDALQSQLEKDPDLKAIMLQETPWVLEAKNETEQRNRISNLFEINTLSQRQKEALTLIRNKQVSSGGWSWWDGMPESPMISTYILSGFGKLQSMGVIETLDVAERHTVELICQEAVRYLEYEVAESYREMRRQRKEWSIGYTTLNELYALSFFKEQNADKDFATAKKYYLGSLEKNWTSFNYGERSNAALVLYRNGRTTVAQQMMQAFRETARKDEAIGMYWPKAAFSFESQLTIHANIMAAFAEIDADTDMDPMRVWLLTQKQTCAWGNAASTAEAVYALLMRGSDWLHDEQNVTLAFGNQVIDQSDAVAGTGFIQRRWDAHEVTEDMRHLTVNNPTNHLVWGGLFRQYFVPIDEVQRNESAFKINRELFVETLTDEGKVLVPVEKRTLQVGDKLVVKITFENTQDMTHVFVKDLRAAGFEPIGQVSRYTYGDGMRYYQTPTDTDMEFFIEFLSKGVHQVEYDMYVTKEGELSNGYALIQCLYAPEFSAYSDGMRVKVGDRD